MYATFLESEKPKHRFASGITWLFAVTYLALLVAPIALHVFLPDIFNGDATLLLFAYIAATYGMVSIVLATKTSFDASKNGRQNDLVLRMLERQIELAERSGELAARSLEIGERSVSLAEAAAQRPQRLSTPMSISLFGSRAKTD